MRRADRLFQIIQILRSARRPVTSGALAATLETSVRTIYRDVEELQAQRVPIRGEAGIGYVLGPGYDLPPLMLTADEIEAVALGAQWVEARGDRTLADAAHNLIAKIRDVLPAHLQPVILKSAVMAASTAPEFTDTIDLNKLRASVRRQQKIQLVYRDPTGNCSERVIWPIALAYFEAIRLIVAWCEHRQAFRHFRTDRIARANFLDDIYPTARAKLLKEWWRQESMRASQAHLEHKSRKTFGI